MRFRNKTSVTGVWDDHDYGRNDGNGFNNPLKEYAKKKYLEFL